MTPNQIYQMDKKNAKKLVAEFHKAHNDYSLNVMGHWQGRAKLKSAELKNGYWHWKGYKISDLIDLVKKLSCYEKENPLRLD